MRDDTRFVGLDVSKNTVAVAIAPGVGEPYDWHTIPNTRDAVAKMVETLRMDGSGLAVCYEAGPTGLVLLRQLQGLGVSCLLAAPSLIPVAPGEKVKTDRKDALKLARMLRSDDLVSVYIPSEIDEDLRDLARFRATAQHDATRHKNVITKQLMRWGIVEPSECKTRWTQKYWRWLRTLRLRSPSRMLLLSEAIGTLEGVIERVKRLDQALEQAAESSPHARLVEVLQGFRGIKFLTAVSLVAELGDLGHFPSARSVMGYSGLGSREDSSGKRRRRGAITKSGNAHLRHRLLESSWQYQHTPRVTATLAKRREALLPAELAIVRRADLRLCRRFHRLSYRKPKPVAVTAVAREFIGFIWALAAEVRSQRLAA